MSLLSLLAVSALTCMRVQCTLIGCCYQLTSSGRNNRREQSLLVQQPSRVGKLLWSSVVLLLSGRCSSQQKDEHTYYWGELRLPLNNKKTNTRIIGAVPAATP
jgi:hypothetical protein